MHTTSAHKHTHININVINKSNPSPIQYALTDEGCDRNAPFSLQSRPFLTGNLIPPLHRWSDGKRCFKQTFKLHFLQVLQLEKVNTSLQRFTGHRGFCFFAGSQLPDLSCRAKTAFSSSPNFFSIDMEHVSHITTILLLCSDFGQLCDLYVLCSKQNTFQKSNQEILFRNIVNYNLQTTVNMLS